MFWDLLFSNSEYTLDKTLTLTLNAISTNQKETIFVDFGDSKFSIFQLNLCKFIFIKYFLNLNFI